jgi:hypothetical protein
MQDTDELPVGRIEPPRDRRLADEAVIGRVTVASWEVE